MAHCLEQANGVGRQAPLDAQFVRPKLVMRARRVIGRMEQFPRNGVLQRVPAPIRIAPVTRTGQGCVTGMAALVS